MTWTLTNTLAAFLLPPLNLFMLGAVGWLLTRRRHPRIGKALITAAIVLLWLLSTPFVAHQLLTKLETGQEDAPRDCHPQAIVVLSAGTYVDAPEYGGDSVPALGLERLRRAAHLHRQTRLPILITGGRPDNGRFSEAGLMRDVLQKEFNVPVEWIESRSINTYENAVFSQQILRQAGIKSVYLVTQAWHMPRAQHSFTHAGLCVVPAGTGFTTRHRVSVLSVLPRASALYDSQLFMHEAIGLVWYRLKG